MILDLRFVEKEIEIGNGLAKTARILQAYDGHVWFDVPAVAINPATGKLKLAQGDGR